MTARLAARNLENRVFLGLLLVVTLALGGVLAPFYGALFWAAVVAIVFMPVQRRLVARLGRRRTAAALITLALVVLLVILPLVSIGAALTREASGLYRDLQSGQLDVAREFDRIVGLLPAWAGALLDRIGLGDLASLKARLGAGAADAGRALAARVVDIGQNTLDVVVGFFVMLYVAFFLIRDGTRLTRRLRLAIPLEPAVKRALFAQIAAVVRATVKGNILVAIVQGALGGIAFRVLGIHGAVLWGTLMAFLSLLPAVGAALVWLPVALWLLLSGQLWQGLALAAWGTLVIGLVDNVLRPILVGKDIRMPDWLVLLTTLGGLALFGLNGFVIGPMVGALFLAVWELFVDSRPTRAR